MPGAALHIIDSYRHAPTRRSAYAVATVGGVLGVAVWMSVGTVQASGTSAMAPLYPANAPAITMVAVPNLTVLQLIRKLPITSRYDMLLSNSAVAERLSGDGPYTLFAPADNYFDYLPKGVYVSLSRANERELAEHLVVSGIAIDADNANGSYVTLAQDELPVTLGDGSVHVGSSFAIRGYRAKNGIVYVINQVLAPDDLTTVLQAP